MGCKQPQAAGCVSSHGLALAWARFHLSGCHRAVSGKHLIKQFVFDLGKAWCSTCFGLTLLSPITC